MTTDAYAFGQIEKTNPITDISPRKTARAAGLLYIIIIVAGLFAEFFVRSSLVVSGDATATANNIMASQSLFRLGFVSDLIMIMCDVGIGLIFYVLLKPVSNALALLAAFFRLAQATTLGINLLNMYFAGRFVTGAGYLSVLGADQSHALGLLFLDAHGIGYSIAMVFFGLSILILGYLVIKSGYFPRILGILLVLASLGYLFDSLALFLLPNYSDYEAIFSMVVLIPAFIGELVFCVYLLIKGLNVEQWQKRALRSTARVPAS